MSEEKTECKRRNGACACPSPHLGVLSFIALSLFILLSLSSPLFAQGGAIPQPPGLSIFNAQSTYGPLIQILLVGMVALSGFGALVIMLSRVFKSADWETQGKTELYQVFTALIWGLFILAFAVSVDQITTTFAHGTTFDAAQSYLGRVICLSSSASIKLEGYKMSFQFVSGMRSKHYAAAWGFSYPTFPGFEVLERAADLVQMFIIPFASSLYVQSIGLEIIHGTALVFLMPAGLLLRLFPPTREAGGFMLASAFALYFVLPFTYLIFKETMEPLYVMEYGVPMCSNSVADSSANLSRPGALVDSLALSLWPSLSRDLLQLPKTLSYVALQAVFLPALAMILVVTFIRTTVRFFGQGMNE